MGLIESVSYSFLQNGIVFGEVVPQRRVRLDDPISPYDYILCAEGLNSFSEKKGLNSIIRRDEEVGL